MYADEEVKRSDDIGATVFTPLTVVIGVYGMNFAGTSFAMPELGWTAGYPATMLGMGSWRR
ncbi:CorA family divalent cation transporter [Halolamina salifodinae]|uniref:Mg2+ and Co2+ transporter CorA n=1 Tax=Halolamina salifodinae TaxID=1202767 RepID=A0A8T4GXQ9_9EURY|nr:CorA family divalent cation transporter [Halolamina salifodinae]MBP1986105.1 Mg2+ and Co2+ transporter CorA [Halolamina salifodinae]